MTSSNRIEIWDGWRGLAISFLLIGHFFHTEWIHEERLGVDIFFVLSGMLMSKILFEKRMPLKDFYIRRFSRIFPVLFLFIATTYIMATLAGFDYQVREIFANLFFIRTYYPSAPHIWDVNVPTGHLWSLNVEEHAYLLMSVMTLLLLRSKTAALGLMLLGSTSVMICFYQYNQQVNNGVGTYGAPFNIRTECAISFVFLSAGYNLIKNHFKIKVYAIIPVLTFMIAIVCYIKDMPNWLEFSLAPIMLAFTVNHLLDASRFFQLFLSIEFIKVLGIWSYSIYIWQQYFYHFSYAIPGGVIAGLLLSILTGALSFVLYEDPIRIWINKRWTNKYSAVT